MPKTPIKLTESPLVLDTKRNETTAFVAATRKRRANVHIAIAAVLVVVACSVDQPLPSESQTAICDNVLTYGGAAEDRAYALAATSDGEVLVTGYTTSFGAGGRDLLLLRVDADRNLRSANQYGGSDDDWGTGLIVIEGDSVVVTGGTKSDSLGGWDLWLLEIDSVQSPRSATG